MPSSAVGIWKAEERWRAITRASERRNLIGRGYPRSDIRRTYSRRAFSSQGVRYCCLVALSLREGLPQAWRHNVDLLGSDGEVLVLHFAILSRVIVGRSAVSMISIVGRSGYFLKARYMQDAMRSSVGGSRMAIFRKCREGNSMEWHGMLWFCNTNLHAKLFGSVIGLSSSLIKVPCNPPRPPK